MTNISKLVFSLFVCVCIYPHHFEKQLSLIKLTFKVIHYAFSPGLCSLRQKVTY